MESDPDTEIVSAFHAVWRVIKARHPHDWHDKIRYAILGSDYFKQPERRVREAIAGYVARAVLTPAQAEAIRRGLAFDWQRTRNLGLLAIASLP